MAIIPVNKKTTEYQIESKQYGGNPRNYLGMSGIGNECLRAQWFSWRWATKSKVIARVNRIFGRGHAEEASVIKDLNGVGIKVFRRTSGKIVALTGKIGEVQETLYGFENHAKGHPDGRLLGVIESPKTEHLLEIKTMKDSKFEQLCKATTVHDYGEGLRKTFLGYFGQVTRYMDKMKLKRTLFVATNKDTQARKYIRIKLDKTYAMVLREREENIVTSERPPVKRFTPDHFKCTWCNHHQMCHYDKTPERNCRTCVRADVLSNGKWNCSIRNKRISTVRQLKGCISYKRLF